MYLPFLVQLMKKLAKSGSELYQEGEKTMRWTKDWKYVIMIVYIIIGNNLCLLGLYTSFSWEQLTIIMEWRLSRCPGKELFWGSLQSLASSLTALLISQMLLNPEGLLKMTGKRRECRRCTREVVQISKKPRLSFWLPILDVLFLNYIYLNSDGLLFHRPNSFSILVLKIDLAKKFLQSNVH